MEETHHCLLPDQVKAWLEHIQKGFPKLIPQ